jgi:hypothetical protein
MPIENKAQAQPFKPAVYQYHINLDERGEFYADVRNTSGNTVFEIKGFDIFEEGWMDDKRDINGLREYLISLGIMKTEQHLQDVETNKYASNKYAMRKLAIRSMGREPMSKLLLDAGKNMNYFASIAINAGYNKDEIVDGIMRYFNQSREVATAAADKVMQQAKLAYIIEEKMKVG